MKTFKVYLTEYAPTSTSDIIFVGAPDAVENAQTLMIPISSSMFKRIFPDTIRTTVFHALGPEDLEGLKKIEGKKKSVSAFFKMLANEMESGIASDGGVVAELDGDILVSADGDINTAVDNTGRRWAPMDFLMHSELKSPQIKSVFKDLNTLIEKLVKKHLPSDHFAHPELIPAFDVWGDMKRQLKGDNKKLSLLIKDYYDGIETVFKKHKKIIGKALYGYATTNKLTEYAWDEQVVNNIKIKKIHILTDEVDLDDLHDMYPKGLVNSGFPDVKFWDDSSALQTYISDITRK